METLALAAFVVLAVGVAFYNLFLQAQLRDGGPRRPVPWPVVIGFGVVGAVAVTLFVLVD